MNEPLVAIVILSYNGKALLKKFLPFVIATNYKNIKIIVANNVSTDDTESMLSNEFKNIQIINCEPPNRGFAGGYNSALSQIDADYYALINNDLEVTPNWLNDMVTLMERESHIAVCQPKILSYHQRDHFEYAGACGGWIDKYGYTFARGRLFQTCEKDIQQYNDVQEIFWAGGTAMLIRASIFKQLQGFYEPLHAHMEEVDLCWRMQLLGHKIVCVPSSVVYHVGASTIQVGHHKLYLNYRNNLIILYRNLPKKGKRISIIKRLLLDWISAIRCFFLGDFSLASAIAKSHKDFFLLWYNKKIEVSNINNIPLDKMGGFYNRFVALQYFILKRKTFSSIKKN
ncbi:MAG: glycosyltransferase family 2 protein [Phycisphaerales bacterium]|nr:glycosyltransferase family 2 protein [Phycisphaerales bacterium]